MNMRALMQADIVSGERRKAGKGALENLEFGAKN